MIDQEMWTTLLLRATLYILLPASHASHAISAKRHGSYQQQSFCSSATSEEVLHEISHSLKGLASEMADAFKSLASKTARALHSAAEGTPNFIHVRGECITGHASSDTTCGCQGDLAAGAHPLVLLLRTQKHGPATSVGILSIAIRL